MGLFLPDVMLGPIMLSIVAIAQLSPPNQTSQQEVAPWGAPPVSALPPMPAGRSTAIGGAIRDVDPVRDEFTLKIFGGGSIKVLFDERTQVYRDGSRVPVLKLHSEDHASVETALDGTKIFALRIHMLSRLPEGEYQGQVLSYNRQTGELTIKADRSQTSITLQVPSGTRVIRIGQDSFALEQGQLSDVVQGSLVEVKFQAGTGAAAGGVASEISVLASPGSFYVFSGSVSSLDSHVGRLVILNARDHESREVIYDPARLPVSHELHEGSDIRVTTSFDGARYVATGIEME